MAQSVKTLKSSFIIFALLWSASLASALYFAVYLHKDDAQRIAMERAQMSLTKDIGYRTWVSFHGGVYVPITRDTPPNPYLAHIAKRDITTTDGQKLTLMNPAYTLRQLMSKFKGAYGQESRITSLKALNPVNAPDSWEVKALLHVEKHKQPYYEFLKWEGKEMLRYMNPMVTKAVCLKCHGHQGYQVGEVRGGVSVRIPTEELYQEFDGHIRTNSIILGSIWLLGLILLALTYRKLRTHVYNA